MIVGEWVCFDFVLESSFLNPMAHLRRSTRASTSKKTYNDNEFAPSYPEKPPDSNFESHVASLDQQSFPWKQFSMVDDVLVYSLFSSKRRTKGYRSIYAARVFGETDRPVTVEVGLLIRNLIEEYLPQKEERNAEDFVNTARALVEALPNVFSQDKMDIVEQYVLLTMLISLTLNIF